MLEQFGSVTFKESPADRPNPSACLLVALDNADTELLIWESGVAEFNRGPFDDSVFEHLELDSPDELNGLLYRFVEQVRAQKEGEGARDFPVTPPAGYSGPWPPPWWGVP